jgi:DNA-directed RNA polymerase subunit M/transcription elongation factor TFIIS
MTIKFCPKCENLLTTTTIGNKQHLICKKCKIITKKENSETILITEKIPKTKIGTGIAKKDFSGHNFKCKKCENDKCEITDLGMMFGDEDWIYLLKCTKCDHAERIGDWC